MVIATIIIADYHRSNERHPTCDQLRLTPWPKRRCLLGPQRSASFRTCKQRQTGSHTGHLRRLQGMASEEGDETHQLDTKLTRA